MRLDPNPEPNPAPDPVPDPDLNPDPNPDPDPNPNQVYEANLQLRLHMSGSASVMHTWYFASAAVGIGALMLVQLVAVLAFAMRSAFG